MIAIVDSGSTKADWVFADEHGNEKRFHTIGFNPFFFTPQGIVEELQKKFVKEIEGIVVEKVFFYGAGCSDQYRCDIVKEGLQTIFSDAHIEVTHDLLGSARATAGHHPGIACILGTGSNSCSYDGKIVNDKLTNLGYLVGDEGSGTHLGKSLIRGYFYREMPADILEDFEKVYPIGKRGILNKIYGDGHPNVYLASFAKFISKHKGHIYIKQLVHQAFGEFIKRHVRKYKDHTRFPIHFVGSIAYHFQDILQFVLEERNLTMGVVVQKPIDNLVKFHLSQEKILVKK